MDILGISAFYHDSAACLVRDGEVIAAAQEERFTRKKHDPGFPHKAVEYCLREAATSLRDVRYLVFYDKPLVKFERLLETYLAFAPRGVQSFTAAMPVWLKEKLLLKALLQKEFHVHGPDLDQKSLPQILFSEHHESHAASAFFPSPYESAAGPLYGRRGRVGHDIRVARPRKPAYTTLGNSISSFPGIALLCIHVLHRIQSEFG